MILRDTNIQRALKSRQRGWVVNPFRFGGGGGQCTDGPVWTAQTRDTTQIIFGGAWALDRWVLFVNNMGNALIKTSVDGVTWASAAGQPAATTQSNELEVVSNGVAVVCCSNGVQAIRSTDGVNWTQVSTGGFLSPPRHGLFVTPNGSFVCVGGSGNFKRSTDSGATWSSVTTLAGAHLGGGSVSGTRSFIVSAGAAFYSDDNGASWSSGTVPGGFSSRAVAGSGEGHAVSIGDAGGSSDSCWRTTDGATWTATGNMPGSLPWRSCVWAQGVYLAKADSDTRVAVSVDQGQTWAWATNAVTLGSLNSLAYDGIGGYLAYAQNSTTQTVNIGAC